MTVQWSVRLSLPAPCDCEEFGNHHAVVYEIGEREVVVHDHYVDTSGNFTDYYCYADNDYLHHKRVDDNCYVVDKLVANDFEDSKYCCSVDNVGCIDCIDCIDQ